MRFPIFPRRPRTYVVAALLVLAVGAFAWMGRAISTGPAEGTALSGVAATAPAARSLRLGTFNIDGGQGTDDKVDLARTAKCLQHLDVIGMQEVHGFGGDDPPNQAVPLGALLHLPFLYVPAERRWGHDSFGNAFFTDLAVQRWHRVVLPSDFIHAKRNYLLAEATWAGVPLRILATHVDFKGHGDEQLALVIATFLALPEPAILLGDLNHTANDPQIQRLIAAPGVEDCVGRVYDTVKGRVDWIFVRGLTTVDAGIVDLHASDHPAYWAEVRRRSDPATTATRAN